MGKSKKLKSKFMKAKKQKGNMQSFEQRILSTIKTAQKSPLPYRQLLRACKVSDREFPAFTRVLENMKRDRKITETDKGFVINSGEVVSCVISRLNKTFGFAKIKASVEGEEIFIPGRDLMGAMPEDVVAVRITKKAQNGEKAEGQVVRIIEEGFTPKYINIRGKGDLIKELKTDAKNADTVFLATDPDREGEAIAWHLATVRNPRRQNQACKIQRNHKALC